MRKSVFSLFQMALILSGLLFLAIHANGSVKFDPVKSYTEKELGVLEVSTKMINEMIPSECFKTFMLNRELIQTNGLTNTQVIEKLHTPSTVPLVMYYSNNSTVGYRNVGSPTIYTNRKFHAGASACANASNLFHEVSHVIGFGHDKKANKNRPYSVPYSINAAFSACCLCEGVLDCKIAEKPAERSKVYVCYRSWKTLWIKKKCYWKDI